MPFDVKKPTKLQVDEGALRSFAAAADEHSTEPPVSAAAVPTQEGKPTESILFRCTKATMDEFNFVYENTNVKSKQKLLDSIILPELRRRAEAIRAKS